MKIERYVNLFREELELKRYSENTIRNYVSFLERFLLSLIPYYSCKYIFTNK